MDPVLIYNFDDQLYPPARRVSDALGGGCLQRPVEASFLGALNRLHRTKAFPSRGRLFVLRIYRSACF